MTTTIENKANQTPTESELRELGLNTAADKLKADRELARKLRIAFEHFRVVTPEQVERFRKELRERTQKKSVSLSGLTGFSGYSYTDLKFTALQLYPNVPPADVLQKIREAKALGCFDYFEVLTLETKQVLPDPVVFGCIQGCPNRYFVAQWDDDVRIEDILRENEG